MRQIITVGQVVATTSVVASAMYGLYAIAFDMVVTIREGRRRRFVARPATSRPIFSTDARTLHPHGR